MRRREVADGGVERADVGGPVHGDFDAEVVPEVVGGGLDVVGVRHPVLVVDDLVLFARAVAGLGPQPLRYVRVEDIRVLIVGEVVPYRPQVGEFVEERPPSAEYGVDARGSFEDVIDDPLDIDRLGDGEPGFRVGEGRIRPLSPEAEREVPPRLEGLDDGAVGALPSEIHRRRRRADAQVLGVEVDLAGDHRRPAQAGRHPKEQIVAIEVGKRRAVGPSLEVVRIGDERDLDLRIVLIDDQGPGADGALRVVAVHLEDFRREDAGSPVGEQGGVVGVDGIEDKGHGAVVDGDHVLDLGGEVRVALRRRLVGQQAPPVLRRVNDVVGGEVAPIEAGELCGVAAGGGGRRLPFDALGDCEVPGLPAVAGGPRGGEVALGLAEADVAHLEVDGGRAARDGVVRRRGRDGHGE